ncbi:ABC transporter permease [Gemmatimonas sp.]|uniref:ABC transporter permease n=1 Tax=Gemmatimonas sp. TaxID=1962908 RepID=UPI0025BA5E71|nr:ABC transporter permease [Gemmatimonas sp.]MCA2991384.1 ABC transporter permease [Gemmatimonas sp.]
MSMRATLAFATLRRNPARTVLAVLGIAVAAALLLDMVMLATGMRESFRSLLLTRGYQLRVSPKGTLPFDSEATIDGATAIVTALRANPDIRAVSPGLGATLALPGTRFPSVFSLGLESDVQGDYVLEGGRDLPPPSDTTASAAAPLPAVVNRAFLLRSGLQLGDTLTVASGIDAQLRTTARARVVVLTGEGRFFYVPAETPVMALPLRDLRTLLGSDYRDRMSVAMAESRRGDSASVEAVRRWIAQTQPRVTAISTETAIRQVEERLSYFRQLAFVLGAISLGIGFLLVATLVTLSVNERRGEIAVLRAIGTQKGGVLRQVFLEGFMLSGTGIAGGLLLGLVTARWLNGILRDFPGLPAAFDFFLWSPEAAWKSLLLLLVSGTLAGLLPAWRAASIPIVRSLREDAVG